MTKSDVAASSPLSQQQSLQQQQSQPSQLQQHQGPLLRASGSTLLNPGGYSLQQGVPRMHQQTFSQLAGRSPFCLPSTSSSSVLAAPLVPHALHEAKSDGAVVLAPHLSQQLRLPPRRDTASSDLAAAMRMGSKGDDMDVYMASQPAAMAAAGPPPLQFQAAPPPAAAAPGSGLAPQGAASDPRLLHQLLQTSGAASSFQLDGSRLGAQQRMGSETALSAPRKYGLNGGDGSAYTMGFGAGGSGGSGVATMPEAGDGCVGWCSGDDVDAALDVLMEEAGAGAVYHAANNTATLERICFKLHNLHPRDLPRDIFGTMGSWLAAARAEVIQGAVRPGCTQLILDVYARGPDPADLETPGDGSNCGVGAFPFKPIQPAVGEPAVAAALGMAEPAADAQVTPCGSKGRVLGSVLQSELAGLDAAAAAVGAEVLQPVRESQHDANTSASFGSGGNSGGSWDPRASGARRRAGSSDGTPEHLRSYVMQDGNVRAAAATFKKLLGPRAVQSMAASISYEMLVISNRDMGRYVADVRGTLAGIDTPLLLSATPRAVVAGSPCDVKIVGCHLTGPRRRPHARCQGAHVPCSVVPPPQGEFPKLRPLGCPPLMSQLTTKTLPGSHRAEAVLNCTMVDVRLEAPEAGLMMLEWEVNRTGDGMAISNWLPVLAVPDADMAAEINQLVAVAESDVKGRANELRCFLVDLGLLLDYVTRVNQHVLISMSALMTEREGLASLEADVGTGVGADDVPGEVGAATSQLRDALAGLQRTAPAPTGDGPSNNVPAAAGEHSLWLRRSGGGGTDQRALMTDVQGVPVGVQAVVEHDSLSDLMTRPRLSRKHYDRVAAMAPALLAFAADSGMAAVMSWLMDFMLEHMTFGDLAAVFHSVESEGGGRAAAGAGAGRGDLPLLHRAVRSGNPQAVRLLHHRAVSHGLACNLAQPAGPFLITPLHLAALQPLHTGMLHACGCDDPAVSELWATVMDAAGRTPAMYLRRQLALSARAITVNSNAAVLRAPAAAVAGLATETMPCNTSLLQHRSSASSSTTVYTSWASDEPIESAMTATATAGGGHSAQATVECASYGAGTTAPPFTLSDVSSGDGDRDPLGFNRIFSDSVEDLRLRRAICRRGGRLESRESAMGHESLDTGSRGASAAAAVGASGSGTPFVAMLTPSPPLSPTEQWAASGAQVFVRPPRDTLQQLLLLQGVSGTSFEDSAVAAAAEQENERARLQTKPAECSGAATTGDWRSYPRHMGAERTAKGAATVAQVLAAAMAAGCVPGCGSTAPHAEAGALMQDFLGDSTEDWLVMKKELRAKRKQQEKQQEHRAGQSSGAGEVGRYSAWKSDGADPDMDFKGPGLKQGPAAGPGAAAVARQAAWAALALVAKALWGAREALTSRRGGGAAAVVVAVLAVAVVAVVSLASKRDAWAASSAQGGRCSV